MLSVRNQKKFSSLPESNACQTCHRSSCITGDLKDFATLNTRHRGRCVPRDSGIAGTLLEWIELRKSLCYRVEYIHEVNLF